jgi:transcriptional coactivator HFI1/ADA1
VGVAPWVSANDKPTALSKPIAGDAAEQRLKAEVMQLPARDRRRLKDIRDVGFCPQEILLSLSQPSYFTLLGVYS